MKRSKLNKKMCKNIAYAALFLFAAYIFYKTFINNVIKEGLSDDERKQRDEQSDKRLERNRERRKSRMENTKKEFNDMTKKEKKNNCKDGRDQEAWEKKMKEWKEKKCDKAVGKSKGKKSNSAF